MGTKDQRVDAYIHGAADFSKPILLHLRDLVHRGCPDVEETIKWGFPHFDYRGILCSMASFKQHCSFGFWKSSVMNDSSESLSVKGETSMGNFGKLKRLSDLPTDKILLHLIREAVKLNEAGTKVPRKHQIAGSRTLKIPDYFKKAIGKSKNASKTFESFSYSNKKDYVQWVTEAKTEETRQKRLAISVDWLSEGKSRNWKYERK